MPKGLNIRSLLPDLVKLIESEGEYFSHRTALFLTGETSVFPETLTIVSPRRRRNRLIQGLPLVFVCHPKDKSRALQQASFVDLSLPVSTLEKTLIDLLADLKHAPPLATLADLFAKGSYTTVKLLF